MSLRSVVIQGRHPHLQVALNWLLWHFIVDVPSEKVCAVGAFGWGLWVTMFRPLSGLPAWHYLLWAVQWLPVRADWFWGPALMLLGLHQFRLAMQTCGAFARRQDAAVGSGCVFTVFSLALFLQDPSTTGVPIYAVFAYAAFTASYQLALRGRGVRSLP